MQHGLEILGRTLTFFFFNRLQIHFDKFLIRSDLEERLPLLDDGTIAPSMTILSMVPEKGARMVLNIFMTSMM